MKIFVVTFFRLSLSILLVGMALGGIAHADGGEPETSDTQIVNGYRIALNWTNPAQIGPNQFHLYLSDDHAQPVPATLVNVTVVAGAPSPAEAAHGSGGHTTGGHADTSTDPHPAPTEAAHGGSGPATGGHADTPADPHPAPIEAAESADYSPSQPNTTDSHGHTSAEADHLLSPDGPGAYLGEINLPAAGNWVLRATVTINDEILTADFPFTVAAPAPNNLGILISFGAVNGVILGLAAILRPRPLAKIQPA